jgi:Formyl transferase
MGDRDGNDGPRIVVLIAGGALAHMLVNRLEEHFGSISVLKEDPESKFAIVRRRARLIGWRQALGQAAFGLLQKCVARRSAGRLAAIWREHSLNPAPPRTAWQEIGSVNAPAAQAALRRLAPDVVIVYGTRIIKWRTLGSVGAPFINYHAGINPKYRGQDGAYWARSQRDDTHAGVTVHLIDEGIDTGGVLYQAKVDFAPNDNIATYQHRQMAAALPLLRRAVEDALKGQLRPRRITLPSRQWFHPTLWGYLRTGLAQQVW